MGRGHVVGVTASAAAAAVLAASAAAATVPSVPLVRGAMPSTGAAPAPVVVRTRAEAARASARLHPDDRRRLLGLALRTRAAVVIFRAFPSCGHELFVIRLERAGSLLRVHYGTSGPPADVVVCQALTTGYEAVSVPRAAVAGVARVVLRKAR